MTCSSSSPLGTSAVHCPHVAHSRPRHSLGHGRGEMAGTCTLTIKKTVDNVGYFPGCFPLLLKVQPVSVSLVTTRAACDTRPAHSLDLASQLYFSACACALGHAIIATPHRWPSLRYYLAPSTIRSCVGLAKEAYYIVKQQPQCRVC